jgi:hypothetical protein
MFDLQKQKTNPAYACPYVRDAPAFFLPEKITFLCAQKKGEAASFS